jgi:uncharacterized membrane protein
MSSSSQTGAGGLSKSRIEALCDGVFAIAMTLMVFDIKVPEVSPDAAKATLVREVLHLWPRFLVYGISFVMVGVYWVGHHNQYHYIRRTNRWLLWINICFLMFVALIPFSTALLGRYPDRQLSVGIYAANLILVGVFLYLHWQYATSRRRLVDADLDPVLIRLARRRILLAPVILVAAAALSLVSTAISILLFALIPVLYVLPGRIDWHWTAPHRT